MELDMIMDVMRSNLTEILEETQEWICHYQMLLCHNDVVIVMSPDSYRDFKSSVKLLVRLRSELCGLYLNMERELPNRFLNLTLAIDDVVYHIDDIVQMVEEKYKGNEFDLNKYLLVKRLLGLKVSEEVLVDIDDLEFVLNSSNGWISAYVVKEGPQDVCHVAAWKTKSEALTFSIQSPFSRGDYVFNRFN